MSYASAGCFKYDCDGVMSEAVCDEMLSLLFYISELFLLSALHTFSYANRFVEA